MTKTQKLYYYRSRGFLEIKYFAKTDTVQISYGGNMGARELNAKIEFEYLIGKGSWETLKTICNKWEKGGWDYYWFALAPAELFFKTFPKQYRYKLEQEF